MKKIQVGIDISKEKCNLCYRSGLEVVREEGTAITDRYQPFIISRMIDFPLFVAL